MNNNSKTQDDFLIEILTGELPPTLLLAAGESFAQLMRVELEKIGLTFKIIQFYATPRRLALLIHDLASHQDDQLIERKGPALAAAFDEAGKPSKACIGFAKSCGVNPDDLMTIKTSQGEWIGYKQKIKGKAVAELMPQAVSHALSNLPFKRRMRWGDDHILFIRPVHAVVMLYGDQIVDANILGCRTNRVTRGHRFLSNEPLTIPHASSYASLLKTEGFVIADFEQRRKAIVAQAQKVTPLGAVWIESDAFLNEVTGLVEWPVALFGKFDEAYLELPPEVLISEMQMHQRYFPVMDAQQKQLLPHFVVISNIDTHDPSRIITGNERVLRARLADAAFFYEADKKESLENYLQRLKGIVFQDKLGTLYEKAERLDQLTGFIGDQLQLNSDLTRRAGLLAKADLTTQMVNEFPELQGVMGYYYALHDKENESVAQAIKSHYMPRFAGDALPQHPMSQVLSMADKLDTLVGIFATGQIPTGDKDPYGLRRAALGILRILIEKEIALDLKKTIAHALSLYPAKFSENTNIIQEVLNFMLERLRSWYQEQGITTDVFSAVTAVQAENPFDIDKRISAVKHFKELPDASSLSIVNKRVSNILTKEAIDFDSLEKAIQPELFEYAEEKILADEIAAKARETSQLSAGQAYTDVLTTLAQLRKPVDDFFDHVMVMTDDKARRDNRLLMLSKLRRLFLQVADIALLQ